MHDSDRTRIKPSWQALLGDARQIASDLTRLNEPLGAQRLEDHADGMFTDLAHLGEALMVTVDHAARLLPGYRMAARQLRRAEGAVLRNVKRRMDEATASPDAGGGAERPPELLAQLLQDSVETSPRRSLERLHLRILRELVPDEARILSALSGGTRFALIHIHVRGGGGVRTALENASTVGRVAAVHVNQAVPLYVGHLRELGLAEEGPAEELLSDQYTLLTSEDYVQRAIAEAEGGIRGSRTARRTLRISRLGAELWAACVGEDAQRPTLPATEPEDIYVSAYAGAPPRRPMKAMQ